LRDWFEFVGEPLDVRVVSVEVVSFENDGLAGKTGLDRVVGTDGFTPGA
jgi:hypothetical protein